MRWIQALRIFHARHPGVFTEAYFVSIFSLTTHQQQNLANSRFDLYDDSKFFFDWLRARGIFFNQK